MVALPAIIRVIRVLQTIGVVAVLGFWVLGSGVSQNQGCLFGGPHRKDYTMLGSLLGCSQFGKLQFRG